MRELRALGRDSLLSHVQCAGEMAGGMLLMVHRDVAADAISIDFEVLAAGRAGVVSVVWQGGGILRCIGVHNWAWAPTCFAEWRRA